MQQKVPQSYSIWIMPKGNTRLQLQNKIHKVSEKYGGPIFEPHITILGGFTGGNSELVNKTKYFSDLIHPFDVTLIDIEFMDKYFRSIFIKANYSSDLIKIRNKATNQFNYNEVDYLPHLSMAYGNYDISTKIRIKDEIGTIPKGFNVDEIYLVKNNEIDFEWKIIDSFDISDDISGA